MLCLPEIPQFSIKGGDDTLRDSFKTVANSERRFVLCTTVLTPHNRRLPFQFPFVKTLHNLTTRAVGNEMKLIFAESGISPKSLQCDNGPQVTSDEFQQANMVLKL